MRFLPRVRKKPPPSPPELDWIILEQLQGRGADLTRPRHVLHFLYFQRETDARHAAAAAEAAGYDVTLAPPDEAVSHWALKAESTRVVDFTNVAGFRSLFKRIAEAYDGEYDGWEAATEP